MTSSLAQSLGGGSPDGWARDWLVVAGFPWTDENRRTVVAWEFAESGGGGGMWNPLNTTQHWPGATDVNSVGVKNYATRADGLAANAKVIHNGLYGPVVAAFLRGDNAFTTRDAITSSPWGTRRIDLGGIPAPPVPPPVPPKPKVLTMPCIISAHDGGYWIVKSDGSVQTFGTKRFYGSAVGKLHDGSVITNAESSPTGAGYWLVSNLGEVYAFGDAQWHGNA